MGDNGVMPPVRKPPHTRRRTFLKEWRDAFNLSQEECAEIIRQSRTNYLRIENGTLSYKQEDLERLAERYSCEPGDLLLGPPTGRDIRSLFERAHPEAQRIIRRALSDEG